MNKILLPLLVFFNTSVAVNAQIFTIASGNWETPTIWSCTCVPGTGQDVIIQHPVTISATTGNVSVNSITVSNQNSPTSFIDADLYVSGGITLTVAGAIEVISDNSVSGGDDVRFVIEDNSTTVYANSFLWYRKNSAAGTEHFFRMFDNSVFEVANDFTMLYEDNTSSETSIEFKLGDDTSAPTDESPYLHIKGNLLVQMDKIGSESNLAFILRERSLVEVEGNATLSMINAPGNSDIYLYLADLPSRTNPGIGNLSNTYAKLKVHGNLKIQIPYVSNTNEPDIRCDIRGNASVEATNFQLHFLNGNGIATGTPNQDIDFILYDNASVLVSSNLEIVSEKNTGSINALLNITNNAQLTVLGNVVMRAESDGLESRIYCQNNALFELKGNVDRNGSSYSTEGMLTFADASTLKLSGSSAQIIPWPSSSTFRNLEIANTSGSEVGMEGDIRIEGNLTMTEGIVYSTFSGSEVDKYEIRFMPAANSNLGNATSFIHGKVRVNDRAGAANTLNLPLGSKVNGLYYWGPISLTNFDTFNDLATYFEHRYEVPPLASALDAPLLKLSNFEYWEIGRNSSGAWGSGDKLVNTQITVYWSDASERGIMDAATLYGAYLDNNNTLLNLTDDKWKQAFGNTLSGEVGDPNDEDTESGSLRFTVDNTSGSGTYRTRGIALATTDPNENPLPIRLKDFWAEITDGESIKLNWRTLFEHNNHYFTVLKSTNAAQFNILDTLMGSGNSIIEKHYTLLDPKPFSGANYYKLTQTDLDGTTKEVGIVYCATKAKNQTRQVHLYPNPINKQGNNKLTVIQNSNTPLSIKLFSLGGGDLTDAITISTSTHQSYIVDLSKLPKGIYLVHVDSEEFKEYHKIIID